MTVAADLATRFWDKVAICQHGTDCTLCCWPWHGNMVRAYGKMSVPKALRPNTNKEQRATRVCWFLVHGVWPGDMHVLHTCDNPPCVQPAHLWLGTIDDNQKDSMRKGRRPIGDAHGLRKHPEARRRGEENAYAKLTAAEVYAIRGYAKRGYPPAQLAAVYRVSAGNISAIIRGNSWAHLREEEAPPFVNMLGDPWPKQIPRGSQRPNAKVTESDVRTIRLSASEGITQAMLAEIYNVSPSLIQLIVQRKTWTHVEEEPWS